MLPAFRRHLDATPPTELVPVAIYLKTEPVPRDIGKALISEDEATKLGAQQAIFERMSKAGEDGAAHLLGKGLQELRTVPGIPAVFGKATPGTIATISEDPKVQLVMGVNLGKTRKEAIVDPIVKMNIKTVFNDQTFYGSGRKIGVVESASNYAIFDRHQAFHMGGATSNIIYSNPSGIPTCTDDVFCGGTIPARCDEGKCRDMHASRVASVISAFGSNGSTAQGYSASQAQIYFPNSAQGGINANVTCDAANIANAYSWLQQNSVTVSNESFNCYGENACDSSGEAGVDGLTQDYYARRFDMLIVRAAGNADYSCDLRDQEACRNTNNSLCVGASNGNNQVSCFSVRQNPGRTVAMGSTFAGDREEPDLVAFGGDKGNNTECIGKEEETRVIKITRDMAGVLSPTAWDGTSGTSFAAPAAASVAALTQELCLRSFNRSVGGLMLRAILRNGSWVANPSDTRYSNALLPGSTGYKDYEDGAGFLSAEGAREYCSRGLNKLGSGTVNIELNRNNPMPPGAIRYQNLNTPDLLAPGLRPSLYAPPTGPGSTARNHIVVSQITGVTGGRIRFTFSWNGCALTPSGNGPSKAKVDFDAFLFNNTDSSYVAASQSIDDTNEGFDYIVPTSGEFPPPKTFSLIVAWPVGSTGCENETYENGAWALKWGF